MLEVKNVFKRYQTGDLVQLALNNISLKLRANEFVAVLGPSGSGKTTLLNIIGGLDRYDSGDLLINNVSTKAYSDRDWDAYRNHSVGFVFQSYNLIPHQSVAANVELALTIGGEDKKTRKEKVAKALAAVGLSEHAHKKPNQLSGGQMQRVAIARSLVNDPEILLADEPTGALDTETGIQVMELLKEVAKERLVVMVTHNPELAKAYATRIVEVKDGQIIADSDPYLPEADPQKFYQAGKAAMSFKTALSLSFNNLLTKKGRTILTALAGSIGIIGIALILALSQGFQNYIDKIQSDTLTAYPLVITKEKADLSALFLNLQHSELEAKEEERVYEKKILTSMFNSVGTNDLKSFKSYLETHQAQYRDDVQDIRYKYNVKPLIYSGNTTTINKVNPNDMLKKAMGNMGSMEMFARNSNTYQEMLDSESNAKAQYHLLKGRWPEKFDELLIVLNGPHTISDALVYGLGLRDNQELEQLLQKAMMMQGTALPEKEMKSFTYDELLAAPLRLVNPSALYRYNREYGIYEDLSDDRDYMRDLIAESLPLKVVGIVAPNDQDSFALKPGIAYTEELTKYIIAEAKDSPLVKKQQANPEIDIFSGKKFTELGVRAKLDFEKMIGIDTARLKSAFGLDLKEEVLKQIVLNNLNQTIKKTNEFLNKATVAYKEEILFLTEDFLKRTLEESADNQVSIHYNELNALLETYFAKEEVQQAIAHFLLAYPQADKDETSKSFKLALNSLLKAYILKSGNGLTLTYDEHTLTMIVEVLKDNRLTQLTSAFFADLIIRKDVITELKNLVALTGNDIFRAFAGSITIDAAKLRSAFSFRINEEELLRLFKPLMSDNRLQSATSNLLKLGYQDLNDPSAIYIYLKDFKGKEHFKDFLSQYNDNVKQRGLNDKVINYTDMTGMLMASVKTIIDSISYVLIAFVSISLVVSSIMIGIITYISVLERTKEIGILRAIGASKANISSIFNAETIIIGTLSGLLGVGIAGLLTFPINSLIHHLTGNPQINSVLPFNAALILIALSTLLTLIGGLIPSRAAAKKDPVAALRNE